MDSDDTWVRLRDARAELDEVRRKISTYEVGDRPPSPPARLLAREIDLTAEVRRLRESLRPRA